MSNKLWLKGEKRRARRAARTIAEQLALKDLLEGKFVKQSKSRKRAEQVRNTDQHRKRQESALEAEVRRDKERAKRNSRGHK